MKTDIGDDEWWIVKINGRAPEIVNTRIEDENVVLYDFADDPGGLDCSRSDMDVVFLRHIRVPRA